MKGTGGANAWVEIEASHLEPSASDNHVLFDGAEIPVVRVLDRGDEGHAVDATAGQLTPRGGRAHETPSAAHVIAFRVPANAAAGTHSIALRTCQATSEPVAFEVLPKAAPDVASVRLVRGEVWPAIFVKGANLSGVEEVFLVSEGAVTSLTNVTRIDDGQVRVSVEKSGTYDVFVRGAGGIGGGPPNGVVVVR